MLHRSMPTEAADNRSLVIAVNAFADGFHTLPVLVVCRIRRVSGSGSAREQWQPALPVQTQLSRTSRIASEPDGLGGDCQ